ncbi:hypothetical protein [Actinocorallia aurea]
MAEQLPLVELDEDAPVDEQALVAGADLIIVCSSAGKDSMATPTTPPTTPTA